MVAALRRDRQWRGEVRHRHKDGSARFAQETWAIQPGLDSGAASLVAAVEDQTAVKRAEDALRDANATLEARITELMAAEAILRQTVAEWLRGLGYRVLETPDGAAVLRLLDGSGRVDVLVANMGLPGRLDVLAERIGVLLETARAGRG